MNQEPGGLTPPRFGRLPTGSWDRSVVRGPGRSTTSPSVGPWLAVAFLACGLVALGMAWSSGFAAGRIEYPPADLVSLENPQRAAIVRHQVGVTLDPSTHGLRATDAITVLHAPGVGRSEAFSFLLWDSLRVESIRLLEGTNPGAASVLSFTTADHLNPRAFWKRPPYDELGFYERARQIDVRLGGAPDQAWPDTLRIVVEYRGTVMDSLRPPKAAYARSFDETSGLIEERGAYLSSSSFWVPSRPEDIYTFRCSVEAPSGWLAVSQGGLADINETDAKEKDKPPAGRRLTWDCPQPMEEIYLVAGPWTLHQRPHGNVMMQTFTYANTDSTIYNRYLDGTARYLDLYGERIGPYPFAKFALVENFWQTGFGMPSFTLLGDRVIRLPFILDTSYGHEILHNWWGNGVFVDAATGNWCEGLTTYGADYFYKEKEGAEAARDYRRNALVGYLDYVGGSSDIALAAFTGRSDAATQAIGYSKSMMVIHQLRRAVGDARFQAALQDFFRRNLWRRASWSDLLDSFRRVAGIDPVAFREQWIERPGLPSLGLASVSATPEGKGWRVQATLSQSGPASPAAGGQRIGPSSPVDAASELTGGTGAGAGADGPYNVVVPVRVTFAGGDSTWQVPFGTESLVWSKVVPGRPIRLAVDPDFEVARRIDRREIPPSLSRTLGADTVDVIIASGLSPEVEKACRDLAAEWAKGQALTVLDEAALSNGWTPRHSAWYLGLGPAARTLAAELPEVRFTGGPGGGSAESWTIAGTACPEGSTVVLVGDYPGSANASWTLIAPADAAGLTAIGSKVPHYGKYGYLVLHAGTVVQKGSWAEVPSPLVVGLKKGGD